MTEFENFMQTIGSSDEIKALTDMAKGNKEYEKKITEFIKENKVDCNHLWEDSDDGDKAYDDWEKLIAFALDVIPEE